jgi:hypothetical protein
VRNELARSQNHALARFWIPALTVVPSTARWIRSTEASRLVEANEQVNYGSVRTRTRAPRETLWRAICGVFLGNMTTRDGDAYIHALEAASADIKLIFAPILSLWVIPSSSSR